MTKFPLIYRGDDLIVVFQGYPYTIPYSHSHFEEIERAIKKGDETTLGELLSLPNKLSKVVDRLAENDILDKGNGEGFTYRGNDIEMDLSDYIYSAVEDAGANEIDCIINFIKNLFDNPSHDVRHKLFGFMNHNKMPLTPEGCFMAFKVVTSDYLDKYTKKIFNGVNSTPRPLTWSEVDTDPEVTCSRGYHVCAKSYIPSFYCEGDRIVSVVVDPRDVGAVPNDYDGAKIRCRKYTVVADVTDKYLAEQDNIKLSTDRGINPGFQHKDRANLNQLSW